MLSTSTITADSPLLSTSLSEVGLTLNKNGNGISFGNVGINGGFLSFSDGKIGEEHQCFINGIECYAQEGEYGGIIIQSLNNRQLNINQ